MYIKKYYINYGGAIAEDGVNDLPIAKAIFEFKAGFHAMPLLIKADYQLYKNKKLASFG